MIKLESTLELLSGRPALNERQISEQDVGGCIDSEYLFAINKQVNQWSSSASWAAQQAVVKSITSFMHSLLGVGDGINEEFELSTGKEGG